MWWRKWYVFRWDLKHWTVLHCRSSCGNPFQIRGPVTENDHIQMQWLYEEWLTGPCRNCLETECSCYTAQNSPDNLHSYPPDDHHCSDDVYRPEGREWLWRRVYDARPLVSQNIRQNNIIYSVHYHNYWYYDYYFCFLLRVASSVELVHIVWGESSKVNALIVGGRCPVCVVSKANVTE